MVLRAAVGGREGMGEEWREGGRLQPPPCSAPQSTEQQGTPRHDTRRGGSALIFLDTQVSYPLVV